MPLAQTTFLRQVKAQPDGTIIAPLFGNAPAWLCFDGATEPPKGIGYDIRMRRYLDDPTKVDYQARIMIGDRTIDIQNPKYTIYAVYEKSSLKQDFETMKKDGVIGNKPVLEALGSPDYLIAVDLTVPENRNFHETTEEPLGRAGGPM